MPFEYSPMTLLDELFSLAAVMGGLAGLVQGGLLLLGGGLEGDGLEAGDSDLTGDPAHGFRFLSLLGMASFLAMFGLVGLALSRQSRVGAGWSILGALLAGQGSFWIIGLLFRLAGRLQSNGALQPQAAVGCTGTVCLGIPTGGTGRVNIQIGQRLREMDAIHAGGAELATGTRVQVLRVERSLAVVQILPPPE
jgi:hypothetical protein